MLDREFPDPFGITGDIDFYDTILYLNNNDELIQMNLRLWLNSIKSINKNLPSDLRKKFGDKDKLIKEIDNEIGKDNRKKLLSKDSGLIINIFINSPGGHNYAMRNLVDFLSFIKSNSGTINSFCFIWVASAASTLFSQTDKRFCLENTLFLCHPPATMPELDSIFEDNDEIEVSNEINQQEYEEHLNQFFDKHDANHKERIEKIINSSLDKIDCDLYLNGTCLEEFGVIDKAFKEFNDFEVKIEKIIGTDIFNNERITFFIKDMKNEYVEALKNLNPKLKFPFLKESNSKE